MDEWKPFHATAVVNFAFAGTGNHQLSLRAGERVRIYETVKGWYRGVAIASQRTGIFPSSYCEVIKSSDNWLDTFHDDIRVALHEWGLRLTAFFDAAQHDEVEVVKEYMRKLDDLRNHLLLPSIGEQQRKELRKMICDQIEDGNWAMGLDVAPRLESGVLADEENTTIDTLFKMHQDVAVRQRAKASKLTKQPATVDVSNTHTQLVLDVKACFVGADQNIELLFNVYSAAQKVVLTEDFVVSVAKGMIQGGQRALFQDIPRKDYDKDLYLICRVNRIGAMVAGSKAEGYYRRPVGTAMLHLSSPECLEPLNNEIEYFPEYLDVYSSKQEQCIPTLHERMSELTEPTLKRSIAVGVQRFHGTLATTIEAHPDLVKCTVCRMMSFGEQIEPSETRHDIYLRLLEGAFSEKSVEVNVSIMSNSGELFQSCVSRGNGAPVEDSVSSTVAYRSAVSKYADCIHVSVPADKLDNSHVLIQCYRCSSSKNKRELFAFGALKFLDSNGVVRADGNYTVSLNRVRPGEFMRPATYLNATETVTKKEFVALGFKLVSTKATQSALLHTLLRWRTTYDLVDALRQFTYIDVAERIKFLREIFAALFAVLDARGERDLTADTIESSLVMHIFDALVNTLMMFADEKQKPRDGFQHILDTYISEHFTSHTAHAHLLACVNYLLAGMERPAVVSRLTMVMKTLKYIIKFTVASRQQYEQEGGQEVDRGNFDQQLQQLLEQVISMMTKSATSLAGAQTVAMKHFSSVIADLLSVMPIEVLGRIAAEFLQAIPVDDKKKLFTLEKVHLMGKLALTKVIVMKESRDILLPVILKLVLHHLQHPDEDIMLASVAVISNLLSTLQLQAQDAPDVVWLLTDVIRAVLAQFLVLPNTETLTGVHVMLLSCIHLWRPMRFRRYVESLQSTSDQMLFIRQLLLYTHFTLSAMPFTLHWRSMRMSCISKLTKLLHFVSTPLLNLSQDRHTDDTELLFMWRAFVASCYHGMLLPDLKLENESLIREQTSRERFGDLRVALAALVSECWPLIPHLHEHFIGGLVRPALQLMQSGNLDVRSCGVMFYGAILKADFTTSQTLKRLERLTIVAVDELVSSGTVDDNYTEQFISGVEKILSDLPQIGDEGREFLANIRLLLVLLLDLRRYGVSADFEDDRAYAAQRLMVYLKQRGRMDMYKMHVQHLCDMHRSLGNHVEAAFTMILGANTLEWGEQREKMYREAMELFDKGRLWEKSLELSAELRVYLQQQYAYLQVAEQLKYEASLYECIINSDRAYPFYYCVGFYGGGMSEQYRSKIFIYRGRDGERNMDFERRMKRKFPAAQIVKTSAELPEEQREGRGQFVQIQTVTPSSEQEMNLALGIAPAELSDTMRVNSGEHFDEEDESTDLDELVRRSVSQSVHAMLPDNLRPKRIVTVPDRIKDFRANNDIRVFKTSRPEKRGNTGNDIADIWINNLYLVTQDLFPCIFTRSEVERVVHRELSPVEFAVDAMRTKNSDIAALITKHKQEGAVNMNKFTMTLNGVVDAAVSGGVENYRRCFYQMPFVQANPDSVPVLKQLQVVLAEQLVLLEKGLDLHRSLCGAEQRPLQQKMDTFFPELQRNVMDHIVKFKFA
eukprot:TRINITY_DN5933_c0_g1_i1.p1 TRINITY_DN5933_c0_g1~~TRINITY_DN5933_c0_g1_i1.p1  ORF type:complete len:1635 (-),score=396.60 TRINITY_DN5933_c0_g1_i1:118-4926(-)